MIVISKAEVERRWREEMKNNEREKREKGENEDKATDKTDINKIETDKKE